MDALEAIREQLYIANVIRLAENTVSPPLRARRLDLAWSALEHTVPEDAAWRPDESELC